MNAVTFRAPVPSDLDFLAANMREIDRRECRLAGGHEPLEALTEGVAHSLWSLAAFVDDRPVCIFGVASEGLLGEEGAPWMLSVDGIERHAKAVLVFAKRFILEMGETFERLANVVHSDNRSAIRFLRWCGFSFGEPIEIGGETFLPFEMIQRVRQAA